MATVQCAGVGAFEVLEAAGICTGLEGVGDSNCLYHTQLMSF